MTSQPAVPCRASVLIVDGSDDCREVLSTLLELRGVDTFQAAGARQGLKLMYQHRPDVVVLDMDSEAADDELVCREYDQCSQQNPPALVMLGIAQTPTIPPRTGHVIPKPYHYAPLIHKIEELLQRSTSSVSVC